MSGYCGLYKQVKVFVGQYQYDTSYNTYFDAQQVLEWLATEKNSNTNPDQNSRAKNSLVYNSDFNTGSIKYAKFYSQLGFGYDFQPSQDYYQSQVVFNIQQITKPSESFTISFWMKIIKISSDENYFFHFLESQTNPVLSISINGQYRDQKLFSIQMSVEQQTDDQSVCSSLLFSFDPNQQSKFQQFTITVQPIPQFAQYYSIKFYQNGTDITNYTKNTLVTQNYSNRYITDNVVALIIGNRTLFKTGRNSQQKIQDQSSQYIIYDFRMFRGAFIRINSLARGCYVEVGGLLPYCVLCSGSVQDTNIISNIDQFFSCQESRAYPVISNSNSLGLNLFCPGKTQQTYYTAPDQSFSQIKCYPFKTQGIWRQTINQTNPIACDIGYQLNGTGSSSKCVVNTSYFTQMCQNFRTTYCKQSYSSTNNLTIENSIQCIAGWSAGQQTKKCDTPCQPATCKSCIISSYCLTCNSPLFQFNGNCLDNCLGTTAKYHDTVNNKCQNTCPSNLYIHQTNMNLGGVLLQGIYVCISSCPDIAKIVKGQQCSLMDCQIGYFYNNQGCSPCCEVCIDCYGGSYMECLACVPGKFLLRSICGDECSPPYNFKNPINNTCDKNCSDSGLQTVMDTQNPYCSRLPCPLPYIKYKLLCIIQPQPQTYLSENSNGFSEYFDCNPSCFSCNGSPTNCQQCVVGYFLSGSSCVIQCPFNQLQDEINRLCVSQCPSYSLIIDLKNEMRSCLSKCPIIRGGTVITCQKAQYCLTDCGNGYWPDIDNQYCQPCDQSCTKCQTSSKFCQSCQPNFYLYQSSCQSSCPSHLYRDEVNLVCSEDCPNNLLYINVPSASFCVSSCPTQPPYYFYQKQRLCSQQQPYGTYCDENYSCYDCDISCKECSGPLNTQCTACSKTSLLDQSQCNSDCQNKSLFRDQINRKCVVICPDKLLVSGLNCVQQCLATDFTFMGRFCFPTQPQGTYCIGKSCSQCAIQCANCTGPSNSQCSRCNPNFYLLGTSCIPTCDLKKYWNDKINWKCVTSCDSSLYGYTFSRQCDSTCSAYTYINDSLQYCYSTCPEKTFLRVPDSTCQNCHPYCFQCLTEVQTNCLICNPGYYYTSQTKKCDTTCPSSFPWKDEVNWQCQYRCLPSTYSNQNTMQCLQQCPQPKLQYENQKSCVNQCPPRTFKIEISCYDCDPACTECFGTSINQCTKVLQLFFFQIQKFKCSLYYFKELTSCVIQCSINNPYLSVQEGQCIPQCGITQYVEQQMMQCYTQGCPKSPIYFLFVQNKVQYCIKKCPDGFYGSYDNYQCIKCADQCSQCYAGTQYDCIKCQIFGSTINYLYQTQCSDICPLKLWKDPQNLVCQKNCPIGSFYDYITTTCVIKCQKFSYNQDCVDSCPLKTFLSGTFCQSCSIGCETCSGPGELDCNSCINRYFLENSQSCVITCSPRTPFRDINNKICSSQCIPPLVTNPNNYDCSQYCEPGYVQDGFMCVSKCSNQKYQDAHDICIPCDISCEKCFGSLNSQCYNCIKGYYLEGSTCGLQCSSIFFYMDKVNNICQNICPQNTLIWIESKLQKRYCISSCPPSNPLTFGNKCVQTCPINTFQNETQCILCNLGCELCLNQNNNSCYKCIPNYYFYISDQSCHIQCPSNIYQNEIDQTCVSNCPVSTFSINQFRLSCIKSCPWDDNFKFYQYGHQCVQQCPQNTYVSEKMCVGCPASCATCNHDNVTVCYSCNQNYYLDGSSCVKQCSNLNQFLDQVNWLCQDQCPSDITTYNYPPVLLCLRLCPKDYFAYNQNCLPSCPQYTYVSEYFCYDCSVECSVCSGSKSSSCSQCKNGYFLFGTTCSRTCQLGYYQNMDNNTCVTSCTISQFIVQDKMLCLSRCPTTPDYYYQYNHECVQQCPEQTYQDFSTCLDCAVECRSCFGSSRSQCTECLPGFYLYSQYCADFCPNKYPYRDQVLWKCSDSCSVGTFIVPSLYLCVNQCPIGYFQFLGQCLDVCPTGYYQSNNTCSHCSFECQQCFGTQNTNCTYCIAGYFLNNTSCLQQCPIGNWQDTRDRKCVTQCPTDLLINDYTKECLEQCKTDYPYNYQGKCVLVCPSGYFPNSNNFCESCSYQCSTCLSSNNQNCQSCNQGYFLYGSSCSSTCPNNFYKDPSTNQCVSYCPSQMYLIREQSLCSYICLTGQLQDPYEMVCVYTCKSNMYPDQGICKQCAFECNGCYGPKNSDCKKCKDQFAYKMGKCTGPCPLEGYTLVQTQCEQCAFKCLQCQNLKTNCLSCRGDRNPNNNCECFPGYFDDQQSDNCTICPSQCKECISANSCSKCFNNKIGSDCFCMRPPSVKSADWCIDCNVAYPKIYFEDDIDYVRLEFGYQINLNLKNPFSPSNENCVQLFDSTTLKLMGENSLCYLDILKKTSIVVNLGWGSTIIEGSQISIQQNMVMDISDPSCTQTISMFLGSNVLPKQLSTISVTPTAILQLPPKGVSLCDVIIVTVIDRKSSGGRNFTVQSWTVKQVTFLTNQSTLDPFQAAIQLQFYINQVQESSKFKEQLIIKPEYLNQFAIYSFQFIFSNFLGTIGVVNFDIQVSDQQSPSLQFKINPTDIFYSYQDLIIPIALQNYKCLTNDIQKIEDEPFSAHLIISDSSSIIIEIYDQVDAGVDLFNYTLKAFQVSQEQKINITIDLISLQNPSRKCGDTLIFQFSQGQIEAQMQTQNRLIGYGVEQFNIEIRAFDPDIQNSSLSSQNINYIWTCTNLVTLQACKYQSGKTITFSNSPLVTLAPDVLIANQTYVFFVQVFKLKSSLFQSQIIAITTDTTIEELPFTPNYNDTHFYINPTSEITYIIDAIPTKQNKFYFVLMYDWKLLVTQNIKTSSILFRMWDYSQNYSGSNKVILYVFPEIISIPMKFYNTPKIISFTVFPKSGISLLSNFNISLQLSQDDKNNSNQVQFFYYFFKSIMEDDMSKFSFTKGIPLSKSYYDLNFNCQFPSGVTLSNSIYVLAKVTSPEGSISTAYQQINVSPQGANVKETITIIQNFINTSNISLVQQLDNTHKAIIELKGMEDYSCYKDCSSYGSCQSLKSESCICQSSRMLSDCSGTQIDFNKKQNLLKSILQGLNQFISQLDQSSSYIQRLIFEIQFYVTKNLDMSKVVQTLNSSDISDLLDNINIHLQFKLDQMIDSQNLISENSGKKIVSRTPQFIDLGQITTLQETTSYFRLVGEMLSINSQSLKQNNLNKQTVRQLSQINKRIINSLDILSEIMISIQVPGDPIYSLQNQYSILATTRIDSKGMQKQLKKPFSIQTFNNISSQVSLSQYQGLGGRILQQVNTTFYDLLFKIYINNPYSYDSYFPYEGQNYPVFDFQIREMGRKLNIHLEDPIIFNFEFSDPLPIRLVCIQQNKIYKSWENNYCTLNVNNSNTQSSSLVQCLCTNLQVTTIISDINYKYILKPYDDRLVVPHQQIIHLNQIDC